MSLRYGSYHNVNVLKIVFENIGGAAQLILFHILSYADLLFLWDNNFFDWRIVWHIALDRRTLYLRNWPNASASESNKIANLPQQISSKYEYFPKTYLKNLNFLSESHTYGLNNNIIKITNIFFEITLLQNVKKVLSH